MPPSKLYFNPDLVYIHVHELNLPGLILFAIFIFSSLDSISVLTSFYLAKSLYDYAVWKYFALINSNKFENKDTPTYAIVTFRKVRRNSELNIYIYIVNCTFI